MIPTFKFAKASTLLWLGTHGFLNIMTYSNHMIKKNDAINVVFKVHNIGCIIGILFIIDQTSICNIGVYEQASN
jgi:hypothetical protein